MKLDYNQYVDQLPASGYTSDGYLLWQPNWSDVCNWSDVRGFSAGSVFSINTDGELVYGSSYNADFHDIRISGPCILVNLAYGDSRLYSFNLGNTDKSLRFTVPVSGVYTLVWSSPFLECTKLSVDGGSVTGKSVDGTWKQYQSEGYKWTVSSGSNVYANFVGSRYTNKVELSGSDRRIIAIRTPVWKVVPASTVINNNYTINTRVDNLTGIYVDNSDNYYTDVTIVDETNNRYYDMTTKTYYDIKSWSYDYSSRTYFLTLDNDVALTVQFGDTNVTITTNNVSNTYNYVVEDDSGSDPDTPTTCKHEWTETIDTAPTCLEGGHASYTCSKCGETYEQILAAKGHDWKVIEHVNMVYNSDGTVAAQGHTLYQCSVCGEQWYTDTGAPPPDVSGSSSILAWLQEFKVWLGDKLDNLFSGSGSNNFWTSTKDTVADVLSSLLEALLGFITDILGAILDLVKELLSFFFDLLSSVVISGISGFFSGLKDSRLFDFAQKGEDGSVTALPDGVAAVFAFFSGVLLALPVELRSLLFFGTALVVLIGVINIIRS